MSTQYNVVCARSLIRRRNCPHRPAGSKNGGCHERLMAGDVTTYHERHSVAGGLGQHFLLNLRRRQHASYVTIPWEWLPRCVIVYFVVGQCE